MRFILADYPGALNLRQQHYGAERFAGAGVRAIVSRGEKPWFRRTKPEQSVQASKPL